MVATIAGNGITQVQGVPVGVRAELFGKWYECLAWATTPDGFVRLSDFTPMVDMESESYVVWVLKPFVAKEFYPALRSLEVTSVDAYHRPVR